MNRATLFSFVLALSLPFSVHADMLAGKVIAIADGDTVTILDANNQQHRIRLAGIDAPEKKQPFGQASKQSLSDLAYLRTIEVEWSKIDRYGRIVGKILVSGEDINLLQIKRGLAWHYKKYEGEQSMVDRITYANEEVQAKELRMGLWVDAQPVAPWDFRHHK